MLRHMKTLLGIGALALATVVPLVGAEADGIELQVVTDARYYSEHVDNTVFVQVTVRSLETTDESNPGGRKLGLVVDRSGSMTGERIHAARQSVGYKYMP